MKTLFKVIIALIAVGVLAVLFVRSARNTRSQPFTIARQDLTGWTLTVASDGDSFGSLLSLTPKETLLRPLSRELFARMGESLHYPQAAMPLVLGSEFTRAMAGVLTPETLLSAARDAGLESATPQPRCMAQRRIRLLSVWGPPAAIRRSSIPWRCRRFSLPPIWMGHSAGGCRYARIRQSTASHRLSFSSVTSHTDVSRPVRTPTLRHLLAPRETHLGGWR